MTSYPMIYYRTPSTRKVDAGYSTPDLVLQNAPTQCVVFKRPSCSLDSIGYNLGNNINYFKSISNDGTRLINLQDNGVDGLTLKLSGVFTVSNGTTDLANLKLMTTQLNADSWHTFGNVGFYSPNAPFFNVDPTGGPSGFGFGYSVKTLSVNRVTKIPNLYIFDVILGYAGTVF